MNRYSSTSSRRLDTCHPDLQLVMESALPIFDHSIVIGYRGEKAQNDAHANGLSQRRYPDGEHNEMPSKAVDAIPYIHGIGAILGHKKEEMKYFYAFAHVVLTVAEMLFDNGIIHHKVRWGGDWDKDDNFDDQTFNDLYHYELYKP